MAPEQAVGEEIDHRADLYAWGLLAWEALAGRHPFAGRSSAFALIGAQLNEVPAPLASVRDDVPPALVVLVARCLAKDPAERPTDAAEVLGSLESFALAPGAAQMPRLHDWVDAVPDQAHQSAPSVAVLAFANMSADPDAEYFSDGITEEILNALAKLSGLRVMARTSSFAFKGRNLDVREIGRQLGARYVLEGSVRRAGTRIRITAQLIDASQGHHLWSERYDRDMSDVFAVQDEITAAIRDALASRLLGIGQAPRHVAPAIDAATYELFLRGRHLVRHRTGDVEGGMAILREVIRRAPDFAPAYTALAIAWTVRIFYGYVVPRDGWPRVRDLGERAASIDPLHASAYHLLAEAAFYWEWNWAKAEQLYRRALELDANDVETAPSYGMYLASVRRFDESLRLCAHARAQDPLNPSVLLRLMICQFMARRFDETLSTCDHAIALFPELPESYRWKGLALLAMGRAADAVIPLESAVLLSGRNAWAVFDLGQALVTLGQITEAHSLGAQLRTRAASEPVPAWALTLEPQAAVGGPNLDDVFRDMETYCEQRGFWMVMLAVEPTLDWLREDPRFKALVARVGIPATT
jgi:serine/threonine-protein kinase